MAGEMRGAGVGKVVPGTRIGVRERKERSNGANRLTARNQLQKIGGKRLARISPTLANPARVDWIREKAPGGPGKLLVEDRS